MQRCGNVGIVESAEAQSVGLQSSRVGSLRWDILNQTPLQTTQTMNPLQERLTHQRPSDPYCPIFPIKSQTMRGGRG